MRPELRGWLVEAWGAWGRSCLASGAAASGVRYGAVGTCWIRLNVGDLHGE